MVCRRGGRETGGVERQIAFRIPFLCGRAVMISDVPLRQAWAWLTNLSWRHRDWHDRSTCTACVFTAGLPPIKEKNKTSFIMSNCSKYTTHPDQILLSTPDNTSEVFEMSSYFLHSGWMNTTLALARTSTLTVANREHTSPPEPAPWRSVSFQDRTWLVLAFDVRALSKWKNT